MFSVYALCSDHTLTNLYLHVTVRVAVILAVPIIVIVKVAVFFIVVIVVAVIVVAVIVVAVIVVAVIVIVYIAVIFIVGCEDFTLVYMIKESIMMRDMFVL